MGIEPGDGSISGELTAVEKGTSSTHQVSVSLSSAFPLHPIVFLKMALTWSELCNQAKITLKEMADEKEIRVVAES